MASFELNGIKLRIPGKQLNAALKQALERGNYEWNERAALERHLEKGDRVLDIGAGAGYISSLAAKVVGGDNLVSIEASTDMMPVLKHNLAANRAGGAKVLHGAVVADNFQGDHVTFRVSPAFWASKITTGEHANNIDVPALRFTDLVNAYKPSVVVMDIEGGEVDICQQVWPDCVRLLIMEIHTGLYPPATIKAMFDGLSRTGFTYMPWGTRGEVVVQQRVVAG